MPHRGPVAGSCRKAARASPRWAWPTSRSLSVVYRTGTAAPAHVSATFTDATPRHRRDTDEVVLYIRVSQSVVAADNYLYVYIYIYVYSPFALIRAYRVRIGEWGTDNTPDPHFCHVGLRGVGNWTLLPRPRPTPYRCASYASSPPSRSFYRRCGTNVSVIFHRH